MGLGRMNLPTVPWHPEPLDALRRRYPAALVALVSPVDVANGRARAPSKDPACVFDTVDGLRLIVSRERFDDGRILIHISASFQDLGDALKDIDSEDAPAVMDLIVHAWQTISQSTQTPTLVAISPGGVPHFVVEQTH